jgi:hypothetical protein
LSLPELKLDWCSHKAAEYAVKTWHYSRTMPAPPRLCLGVWERGQFIGAVLFSRGACPHLLRPYGLTQYEGCELTRVALTSHVVPVSQIVGVAVRMVKKLCPKLRLVVSFADPMQGHLGRIYQAGNWVYLGETSPDYFHVDKSGKKWHSRQVRRNGAPVKQFGEYRVMPSPDGMQLVETLGKHRYLYPLDPAMRAQIEPLRKPYPKTINADAGNRTGKPMPAGGVTPTRPLQLANA